MSKTVLLSWDMYGLESCIDLDLLETENVFNILKSESLDSNSGIRSHLAAQLISSIMLRARYNPQRHYEIYIVQVDDSIDIDDLKSMFDKDPQGSSDLIRQRGQKLYSDRLSLGKIKIT